MKTVPTIAELRSALGPARRAGRQIGLVPTMGAFHEGHLSLMRHARGECDVVVVSLFVNPAQFNDPHDLDGYPRDMARDAALASEVGADLLFAPDQDEVYPPGFATVVSIRGLTDRLEGEQRGREHFDGVSTVVTKLLNMVGPQVAYFGQKDAQQVAVIRRLVSDLDLPVAIRVCPTVRDAGGLALSSRNVRLSPDERSRAAALSRALDAIAQSVAAGERDPAAARDRGLDVLAGSQVELEYLELVSPDTFLPAHQIAGELLAVIAARVGDTRLIDNHPIHLPFTVNNRNTNLDPEVATHVRASDQPAGAASTS